MMLVRLTRAGAWLLAYVFLIAIALVLSVGARYAASAHANKDEHPCLPTNHCTPYLRAKFLNSQDKFYSYDFQDNCFDQCQGRHNNTVDWPASAGWQPSCGTGGTHVQRYAKLSDCPPSQ